MATPIATRFCPLGSPFMQNIQLLGVSGVLVRHASKTAGGISKNKRTPSRKIPRGFKVEEGDAVHKGQVLATQLQLRYYPGENVAIGHDMTLNADTNGTMMLSKETLNPYPDSPIYAGVQAGERIERIFVHVLPNKQHNRFRLVSLV